MPEALKEDRGGVRARGIGVRAIVLRDKLTDQDVS